MHYILYDVDKIKDFVFDSFKPKEVKGASEMIKTLDFDKKEGTGELMHQLLNQFPGLSVVYSKGGGGLLTYNASGTPVEDICSWLESRYSQQVTGGNITVVSHLKDGDFQDDLAIMNYKLREKKSEKILSKPLSQVTFTEECPRCKSCGKRPAKYVITIVNEKIPYCPNCKQKRVEADKNDSAKKSVEALEELAKIDKEKYPRLQAVKSDNQILIIYGDLNAAGNYLASLECEEKLTRFSDSVYNVLKDIRQKIEDKLTNYGFKSVMPIIGGDDMLIFTHPNAFQLIKDDLFSIEENLEKQLGNPAKMNFSFLLANYNLPIYHLFNISSELLDKTKKAFYNDPPENRNTYYAFYRLRQGEYTIGEKEVYTRETVESLFNMAKHIHGPESQIKISSLHQLLELISAQYKDREKRLNTEYYLARHSEYEKFEVIKKIGEEYKLVYQNDSLTLTSDILEDIIEMKDLLFPFPKDDQEEL